MHAIALGEKESFDPAAVGHKAANLSRLASAYRVPPAFCLSTSVFEELKPALGADGYAELSALHALVADGYERLAAAVGIRDPRVAVRSSATGEDSADASFAGQHETILNVAGVEKVVEAVLDCWRSANTERVAAYRKEKGITEPASVAVLVQQMVDSDVSAIAFGVDPVSEDRSVVVIDAARGLGDRIASGDVTPDRYVVRKSDLDVSGPAMGALDGDEAREIAQLVLALERENTQPVDVECAFAAGVLYLLQCRPITTLAAFPVEWRDPADEKLSWKRDDAHSGRPEPRLRGDYMLHGPCFGLRARAEHDDAPMVQRLEPFCGRGYVAVQRRRDGDLPALMRDSQQRVRDRARGVRRAWDEEYMPALRAHYDWFIDLTRAAHTLPLDALADRWDEVPRHLNDVWRMHMLTVGAAYQVMDELAEKYERLTGGTTLDALKMTQARAPALHQLERDLHRLIDLRRARDPRFDEAFAAFVASTHGNLGNDGEDMRQPSWNDDPSLLTAELDRRAALSEEDPDIRVARLIVEGDAIAARARETLRDRPEDLAVFEEVLAAARAAGPLTEEHNYQLDRQIQGHVRRLSNAIGARLAAEGLVASAGDVWLFHIAEISAALRGRTPLRSLARERTAEFERWQRLRHPLYLGSGAPAAATAQTARVDLNFIAKQDAAGVIKGVPACAGRARGRVRLVHSSSDFPKMTKGDVLVCRSSNVSWIPLFTLAAAVVTDVGGALSHAAVVAREFGVPAVSGCGVAMATLKDGALVEVDGAAGTVRVVAGA